MKGVVIRDCICEVNGDQALLEGDIVNIEKHVPELNLFQCRLNEKVGLYKCECIKVMKRLSPEKSNYLTINVQSPVIEEKKEPTPKPKMLKSKRESKPVKIKHVDKFSSLESEDYQDSAPMKPKDYTYNNLSSSHTKDST